MPKKYDVVRGRLEGKGGLLIKLSRLSKKSGFRLVLLQKDSGSEYLAVIEYEKTQKIEAIGEVV